MQIISIIICLFLFGIQETEITPHGEMQVAFDIDGTLTLTVGQSARLKIADVSCRRRVITLDERRLSMLSA